MQVVEADALRGEAQGVGAVALGLEADGHLAHLGSAGHSVVLAFDGHVDLRVVRVELDLKEVLVDAEAQAGHINDVAALAH